MSKAEEFIQNYTRDCSNEIIGGGWVNGEFVQIFKPWLTPNDARRAVEIARDEVIEKAVKWLKDNLTNAPSGNLCASHYGTITKGEFINDFRKAIEED